MKYNKILNRAIVMTLALLALTFTACDNDDSKSGTTLLEAFGPSPALRGGKLTFIGRNLDQVTSVVLPDDIEITDFELIDKQHLKITIPQHAEVGYVKLIVAGNTTLTSKSQLSYIEPIVIEKISPSPIKAGQELTIEGDYLNLMTRVIFADNVAVTSNDFITWERSKIVLTLPLEAQTGKITLADDAVIPVELESEETLNVVLPSVDEIIAADDKKPGDVIEVKVNDIDLVHHVTMPNDELVEFQINDDKLSFTLPVGVTDGVISIVAHSGVKVPVATIGMVIPTQLEATPNENIKADELITIKGINLDVVTNVLFPGMTEAVELASQTDTEITVIMPKMAISGDLTLNTASGNSATITISTLKPSITAYNPASVAAGSSVTLEGQNLDLVTSVTFGGGKIVEVSSISQTELVVTVPVDAESGKVTLLMENGESVECDELEVTKPVFCYIPTLPSDDEEIHAGNILTLSVQNGDKLMGVQINGADTQYILQGETNLYVSIPNNAAGKTTLTLISSNGKIDYVLTIIGSGTVETVIMNEVRDLGSWAGEDKGGAFRLYKESFEGVAPGSILKFYFAVTGYGQMQLNNANWAQWKDILVFEDPSQTSFELEITQDFLDNILTADDGWSTTAMIIQGQNLIVSKVSIITKSSSEVVLMDEVRDLGSWTGEDKGGAFRIKRESFADVKVKVGSIIKLYTTMSTEVEPQLQINNANWGQWQEILKFATPQTEIELTVDDVLLDALLNVEDGWSTTALIIQGQGIIVKKVTLIP